ncbi:hypothetical protein Nepgr_010526 [Nepenthes gracilis]|uniref:Ribosomal protein L1 n=1 Tax=Nepenthes gracilis TaxID=150966 RepID=A0AAD3XLH9_NEPGR|nr:hypothetical protein Nepgr_010526 [Nepenthes gracilis]
MEAAAFSTRHHRLSSSRVAQETVERAVKALLKWKASNSQTRKPQLLSSDEFMYLVLTLKKIPPKGRTNAHKIPLLHPLLSPHDSSELCLFIDDRHGRLTSKDVKEKISAEGIPISKVIKISKLKSDYKPFEAKRKLCDSFDMFLADKRIIPLLPKLLGKHFYKKKKIPVPVELGHQNWKEQIERVCGSALLYLKTGTCSVVRVAKTSMKEEEIVENVMAAINGILEIVPSKWANLRSLHLKFSESLALPIYQAVPDIKFKIGSVEQKEGFDGGEIVKDNDKGRKRDGELLGETKRVSKKGRIHEVRYMDSGVDDLIGEEMASDSEGNLVGGEKSENDDLGSAEIVGRTKKGEDKSKKLAKAKKLNPKKFPHLEMTLTGKKKS